MAAQLTPHVAVIGGGCAGLAAAAALANSSIPVTLFEAGPHLGGRARGLTWQGRRLDNGQHILLGAYRDTLRLLAWAQVPENKALLRLPLQLEMGEFRLSTSPRLPAPLHLLLGLATSKGWSLGERLRTLRFLAWLQGIRFRLDRDEPLLQLLQRKQQPESAIRALWEPLCLAALNTPISCASAQVFLNVLHDSFAQRRQDSDLLIPRMDLTALLAAPLADFIERHGGMIRPHAPVKGITIEQGKYRVTQEDEQAEVFSHVVCAVQPFRLSALLSQLPGLDDIRAAVAQFTYQPIYTIYLQYADTVSLGKPMLGLLGGHGQWVFDRGLLDGQKGLMAVVVSAEGAHQQLPHEALALQVAEELHRQFPQVPVTPLWHKVIAEKRATFSCTAGLNRPGFTTPLQGLYLAGDYVDGPYPATIEGAVRSGVQCAQHIASTILTKKKAAA